MRGLTEADLLAGKFEDDEARELLRALDDMDRAHRIALRELTRTPIPGEKRDPDAPPKSFVEQLRGAFGQSEQAPGGS